MLRVRNDKPEIYPRVKGIMVNYKIGLKGHYVRRLSAIMEMISD